MGCKVFGAQPCGGCGGSAPGQGVPVGSKGDQVGTGSLLREQKWKTSLPTSLAVPLHTPKMADLGQGVDRPQESSEMLQGKKGTQGQ